MAMLSSLEERRRKSRNILLTAFILLIVLWVFKLSYPQYSIVRAYTDSASAPAAITAPKQEEEDNVSPGRQYKSRPNADLSLISDVFNGTITNKAAVIIETRFRTNLIPLILHFGSVLGPSWPIIIYTSVEAIGLFAASSALARYIKSGTVEVRILPQTVLFTNSDSVNEFMTTSWLWENLAPAEHILLFQSDSMLCANAARSVDDFFKYDFVGAPIATDLGKGYNGGLSLRKRSSILRVLEEWDWETTKGEDDRFEDQWYYNRLVKLQRTESSEGIEPEAEGAINLPSMEVARTFSVETIDYPHPLGVHQVHRWLKTQMVSLDEWCPEYKLCSKDHIVDT
ncbi:hypothetical protein G7Y89_g7730 [Cudoniella acicularis]|uniref:DUF5672 domain-containing protein n=1 Tax=Cudoniella acicularis TaxID=354080 RepID=A0A8H4RHW5_9HELO|nr:hypothetical protein G7Y89_g7730 [Cudoniella acicularis]